MSARSHPMKRPKLKPMIRYYCGVCGGELSTQKTDTRNDQGRICGTSESGLTIEVMTGHGGTINSGNFCDKCIVDAVVEVSKQPPGRKAAKNRSRK
jgi:hypothetical protein